MENGHSNGKEIKLGQLTQDPDVNINVLRRSTRIPYYMRLKYSLLNSRNGEDSLPNDVRQCVGLPLSQAAHAPQLPRVDRTDAWSASSPRFCLTDHPVPGSAGNAG